MNWTAITFDWNQVRAFLATLEEGSLSAAARALNLTQPTLGRQVAALEEDLGVTLFERSGRQWLPTPAALEVAEHVRDMAEAATRFSLAANGQSQSIEGVVKVSATEMYAVQVLPAFIEALRADHPGIVIDVVATNALSDLRRREADIAIRNTEPTDPEMIARRLADETGGLFATPEFIQTHGPFHSLAGLKDAPFIGVGQIGALLQALQERGVPITEDSFVTRSESHLVHWELARRGVGFGLNSWGMGALTPGMEPVLPDQMSFAFPVWLVAPRELKTNRRVRLVYDALAAHLGAMERPRPEVKKSA